MNIQLLPRSFVLAPPILYCIFIILLVNLKKKKGKINFIAPKIVKI